MSRMHGRPQENGPRPDVAAAISLLGDAQPTVAHAARLCLRQAGEAARGDLARAAEAGDVPTRLRARALLRALDVRLLLERFASLDLGRSSRGSATPLLQGAVLLTHMVRTFAPAASELERRLRRSSTLLRRQFVGRSLPTCARLLSDHLYHDLGYHGGDASHLELDHVLLDRVLMHKVGVPVTLSLIYLVVARQAGLSVAGVAMPDHFLVRLHGVRPVLVDPFHGGRTVTKADCGRYLRQNGHDQVAEHLRDLSDREVLKHFLGTLRRATAYRPDAEAQQSLRSALQHLEAQ
ncbi:MAG: transglutaminase family protein [Planctomycetes bacterium]|nr:transglutaminase family protein [Planctomycetota bacterium]